MMTVILSIALVAGLFQPIPIDILGARVADGCSLGDSVTVMDCSYRTEDDLGYAYLFRLQESGFNATLLFPRIHSSQSYNGLKNKWVGAIRIDRNESNERLMLTRLTLVVTYHEGRDTVRELLFYFYEGIALYPRWVPASGSGISFAIADSGKMGASSIKSFGSLEEVPELCRTTNRNGQLTLYVVFGDFPDDAVIIGCKADMMIRKSDRFLEANESYTLHRRVSVMRNQVD